MRNTVDKFGLFAEASSVIVLKLFTEQRYNRKHGHPPHTHHAASPVDPYRQLPRRAECFTSAVRDPRGSRQQTSFVRVFDLAVNRRPDVWWLLAKFTCLRVTSRAASFPHPPRCCRRRCRSSEVSTAALRAGVSRAVRTPLSASYDSQPSESCCLRPCGVFRTEHARIAGRLSVSPARDGHATGTGFDISWCCSDGIIFPVVLVRSRNA